MIPQVVALLRPANEDLLDLSHPACGPLFARDNDAERAFISGERFALLVVGKEDYPVGLGRIDFSQCEYGAVTVGSLNENVTADDLPTWH